MWSDLGAKHRHSRAQTRRQRCYQSLGATGACPPPPRNIPMMPDFQSTSLPPPLDGCILSSFFLSWTVLLLLLSSALLSVFRWDLSCNLQNFFQFPKPPIEKRADLFSSTWTAAAQLWAVSTAVRKSTDLILLGCDCGKCWWKCAKLEVLSRFSAGWNLRRISSACGFDRKQISFHVVAWICRSTQGLKPVVCKCLDCAKTIRNHWWNTQIARAPVWKASALGCCLGPCPAVKHVMMFATVKRWLDTPWSYTCKVPIKRSLCTYEQPNHLSLAPCGCWGEASSQFKLQHYKQILRNQTILLNGSILYGL